MYGSPEGILSVEISTDRWALEKEYVRSGNEMGRYFPSAVHFLVFRSCSIYSRLGGHLAHSSNL